MPPPPQISVLVPCRDDQATLAEALASLAAQSFGEFEAVVSDDGSRDASPEIAAAWAARDPRIVLLRHAASAGMAANWNRALAAARGARIAKLDADDLYRPGALAALAAAFEATPGLAASFCRVEVEEGGRRSTSAWPGEGALRAAGFPPEEPHVARGRALWLASLADVQLWHSNAFLVPREELLARGGFDERWSCAADTALLLRILGEDRPVAHLPEVGVVYRRRAGSVAARFAAGGWKALEVALVRLDALARDARRLAPLPRAARQAWWQAWRNLRTFASDRALWRAMPAELSAKLARECARAVPPPAAVRIEGWLRLRAHRARARLGRRAAREAAA
jgi:glycosyltransferase involved in cell wall biosynthesis